MKPTRIFKANFPPGFLGTTAVTDPTTDRDFFSLKTDAVTGVNTVTVDRDGRGADDVHAARKHRRT